MKRFLLLLAFSMGLTGCVVGPTYYPPMEEDVPDDWHPAPPIEAMVMAEEPEAEWWDVFQDPLLSEYIALAACWNKDVHIAEANLWEARAARAYAASFFYPQIALDINATRQAFSKNGPLFFVPSGMTPNQQPSPTMPRIQNLFNFLFDASWEIDLFGKTCRSVQAASARVGSAYENLNDTLLSVFAEVARNYVEVRNAQRRYALLEENISLVEKNANLIRDRVRAGLDNNLSLERIEAEISNLMAQLPPPVADTYSAIFNLSILTGQLPEALLDELLAPMPLPDVPREIAIGIRSDILRRRPDVRKAERELAASVADIGVAVASFFPTFTLSGDIGLQSVQLNKLFKPRSLLWSYGADLNTPLFQGGRLKANLLSSQAASEETAGQYEKAVLTALKEAETFLTAFNQDLVALREWQINYEKNENIINLTEQRYLKGLVNLTDLIDAQRQILNADQNRLNSQTAALIDLIAMYKALGGGWACP